MFSTIQVELSVFSLVEVFSLTTAVTLAFLFLNSKSENKKANLFLAFFLSSLAGELLAVLSEAVIDLDLFIPITSWFTIPFLYLYVNKTINASDKTWTLLLLLPGLLINVFTLDYEIFAFLEYLFNISILIYIVRMLKLHKARLKQFYSDFEYKTLKWIKLIVFIYLAFHALWIIEDVLVHQVDEWNIYFASLSSVLTLFMVLWIGHNGFSQPEIFKLKMFPAEKKSSIDSNNSDVKTEIELSAVSKLEVEQDKKEAEFFETIRIRIQNEKLFTNPKLNLNSLAISLDLNEKDLSRFINVYSTTNFYQFINQFRVSEFKELLKSNKAQQLSLLGLAEEAGFNSKSTFYTAFKSLEGMTPKQYELSIKQSE